MAYGCNPLCDALIQPQFEYCSPVWENCGKTLLDRLQKLQNRAAWVLIFSCYDADAGFLIHSWIQQLGWKHLFTRGCFPFTKNSRFEFSEISVSNGTGLYSVITWSVFASGFLTPFIVRVQTVRLETFEWNTRIFENTEISTFQEHWKGCPKFSKIFSGKDPIPFDSHPKFSKISSNGKRPRR